MKPIKLKSSYKILLFIICLISTSCKQEGYTYYEGFRNYMTSKHDINIMNHEDKIFYILPLSDCTSCQSTSLNLELLASFEEHNDKLTVLLIGQTNNSIYQGLIKKLTPKFDIINDTENTIFSYQTGLGKPMLLHIKKGSVKYHLEITDFKIEEAEKYIVSAS